MKSPPAPLLASTVFVFGLVATMPVASAAPFRIATFNTECLQAPDTSDTKIPKYRWNFARRDQLEDVANVIETLEPDVICLVEVTSKAAVDALLAILNEKGIRGYKGYHVESQDYFSGFDVAFLTRHKPDIIDKQPVRLIYSPAEDDTWRAPFSFIGRDGEKKNWTTGVRRHALMCTTIGSLKLGFLGLHLKSDPSDDYANSRRTAEAKIVQRIVDKEIVARGYKPIILGDLNDYDPDVPDRDDKRSTKTKVLRMLKDYDPSRAGDELTNAAIKIQRIADRYTSHWDRNENGAADIGDVYTMIDFLLLPTELMPHVRRTFVCRLSGLRTSDHWPVVVDFDLP